MMQYQIWSVLYCYNTYTGERLKVAASVGCILLPINTMLEESGVGVGFKVGVRVGLKITDSASPAGMSHSLFYSALQLEMFWGLFRSSPSHFCNM